MVESPESSKPNEHSSLKWLQSQVMVVLNTQTVTWGISALPVLLPSHSTSLAATDEKPTLQGSGKRVAKDGGQMGSCGELKLQTKAYLQITEPKGWKRNPPCVIVSHVLPPPVIFSRLKHAPCPYSEDRPSISQEKTKETTEWELHFPLHMR